MENDDEICCCHHVSLRKLVNFARRANLKRASQMSECCGAGTGCGWCVPMLKKIFELIRADRDFFEKAGRTVDLNSIVQLRDGLDLSVSPEEYGRRRAEYRREKGAGDGREPGS